MSYNVIDWKAPTTLNTYLVQQMHQQSDQRRAAFTAAVKSGMAMQAYQDSARARYRRLLGPLPARTPLKARVGGKMERAGYQVEKVIYESTPRHHVTANLYVPKGKGKWPAVLLFCGHEATAKATESYQKTAILFAQNGFVVLVIDPISQGERYQLTDASGQPLTRGGTTEHTLLNGGAALLGTSVPAAQLWDNVRGLDYLLTRREVDPDRIGCLGNSGGATQTAYFIGFDPRVKVAALCSYVASGESNLELTGPADGCVQIPGAGLAGLDLMEWPLMFAPKPLLLLAGRYDFVDYASIQATYHELKQAYTALEKPGRINLFTYDDGHGISLPKREAAVAWFRRWLRDDAQLVPESDLATLSAAQLQCTSTGQVNTAFPQESTLSAQYLTQAQALASRRQPLPYASLTAAIRHVLALPETTAIIPPVEASDEGSVQANGIAVRKLLLRRAGQPPLPALLAMPPNNLPPTKVIIWLPDQGKAALADSAHLLAHYLQERAAVLLVDLRGLGETTDPAAFNDPKYYNREYRPALLALHLGRPLLGQRVEDVFSALSFIRQDSRFSALPVEVYANGRAAPVALHAAVLSPQITRLELSDLPGSFHDILTQPTHKDWYSLVLPNVLRYYDLSDLAAAIGPQRLHRGEVR
ncbi:putative xylan esterase [Hymenobacter roseosalivarius DSM 11622]|uniref:Putative xylan esterase n=1 Tax=Hymenobacter roseosalivarius DSM 11622 TaxID=645990 RepID=A0A1W1VZB0_9BACT|nr:acetylxylan esterase [Hymenobacter roseosalivarius]SMB98699.1 putative xylan esterase [Hymenobacter roseosalivarius DSM 11622]